MGLVAAIVDVSKAIFGKVTKTEVSGSDFGFEGLSCWS